MGACFSQPDNGNSTPARQTQISQNAVVPKVKCEIDDAWIRHIEILRQLAIDGGGDQTQASAAFYSTTAIFQRARDWIDKTYPECARAGTIEQRDIGFSTTYGPCRYPTKMIIVGDDDFMGDIYAIAIVVAVSSEDDKSWPNPGAYLDGPDTQGALETALAALAMIRQNKSTSPHAVVSIFIGADLMTFSFDADNSLPTIKKLNSKRNTEYIASHKNASRAARKDPDDWRGVFRSAIFKASLNRLSASYPGCTLWDEGQFPFTVSDVIYPHPTRLLVARHYESMVEDVEATHYKITTLGDDSSAPKMVLLRNSSRGQNLGGIVGASLVVAVAESEIWPQIGACAKTKAMKAAEKALLEIAQKWNKEGISQRCILTVSMGADMARYKMVGGKFERTRATQNPTEVIDPSPVQKFDGLEAFYVQIEEQKKHELFQSESQFQAIKTQINDSALQNPEHYAAMMPMIAVASATHFLETNFPGCEVSDEGEFPVTIDGCTTRIAETRLVTAKNPKEEKHNVIAAFHLVPSPKAEGWAAVNASWLDTKEMKAAEDALLAVLKQWYAEGKIAEDCMAQVMMGVDATIYRFVDGERFEDYSDERMAQLNWG